ncbi:hypothetical protein THRCLA_22999 [Thraustotheca clavata]|uniref:Uncharacterized protein n=1 Tax=Thraustotheca clavata TaxID=74557 RepID=A0A1V9YJG5_9STRA|nr:hypothetical protein THRCLA_22999 [Thraustotheca clavata]
MKDEMMCRYTYKPCPNKRSIKQLHTLCEFHRAKANTIQRAFARKKRMTKSKGFGTHVEYTKIETQYPKIEAQEENDVPICETLNNFWDDENFFKRSDMGITFDDCVMLKEFFNVPHVQLNMKHNYC